MINRILGKIIYRSPHPPCKKERMLFIKRLNNLDKFHINFIDIGCTGGISKRYRDLKKLNSVKFIGIDADEESTKKEDYDNFHCELISNVEEMKEFYITKGRGCSSVFKPKDNSNYGVKLKDWFDVDEVINKKSATLSQLIKDRIDFIDIDVQGSELNVLTSGKNLLKNVIGVCLESHLYPYYEKHPLFPELHNFMLQNGFRSIRVKPRNHNGYNEEIEVVYIKDEIYLKTEVDRNKAILWALVWDNLDYVKFLEGKSK